MVTLLLKKLVVCLLLIIVACFVAALVTAATPVAAQAGDGDVYIGGDDEPFMMSIAFLWLILLYLGIKSGLGL